MTDMIETTNPEGPFPPTIPASLLELAPRTPLTTTDITENDNDVDHAIIRVAGNRIGVHLAPSPVPGDTAREFLTIAPVLAGRPVLLLAIAGESASRWRESVFASLEHAARDEFGGDFELRVWPSGGAWVVMQSTYTDSEGVRW